VVNIAFAPEILKDTAAHSVFGRTDGVQMAEINPELAQDYFAISFCKVRQEPIPGGFFSPEIPRGAVWLLVRQRAEDAFA
jgi:hypothetical protein